MPGAQSRNFEVLLDGAQVDDDHFISFTIDRDINQPDMAAIVLSNQGDLYSNKRLGTAVEIQLGTPPVTVYKGEVIGLEPSFVGGGKTTILMRAMNKFHRLLRKRKSITFTDMSDADIVGQVVSGSGLLLEWDNSVQIRHKHVYQHNLSDLEFVRMRCGRLGMHVWCVDQTVHCKFPDLQSDSQVTLSLDPSHDGIGLKKFTPLMSSAAIVDTVTVKGWNPETKELITGTYKAQDSKLGNKHAAHAASDFGANETFTVDQPIWTKEEANALAKGRHSDLSLGYITGTAETIGSSKFELGTVVTVTVGGDGPFNGKYYIMGVTHRHAGGSRDGMTTSLRLARDAQGA